MKEDRLMWLMTLGMFTPLEGWRSFKMSGCRHLRVPRTSQDKTRKKRREQVSHNSLTNLV